MTDTELFLECVNRMSKYGITCIGTVVYSNHGETPEFNCDGYNLAFNLKRLGDIISNNVNLY